MIDEAHKKEEFLKKQLMESLSLYEELFRASNKLLIEERSASGSMAGLEDFYRMVQTIRRNRDLLGSLLRGLTGLRSLAEFRIIEQEEPKKEELVLPKEIFAAENAPVEAIGNAPAEVTNG